LVSGCDKVTVFTAVFRQVVGTDRSPVREVPTIIPRRSKGRGVNLSTELPKAKEKNQIKR